MTGKTPACHVGARRGTDGQKARSALVAQSRNVILFDGEGHERALGSSCVRDQRATQDCPHSPCLTSLHIGCPVSGSSPLLSLHYIELHIIHRHASQKHAHVRPTWAWVWPPPGPPPALSLLSVRSGAHASGRYAMASIAHTDTTPSAIGHTRSRMASEPLNVRVRRTSLATSFCIHARKMAVGS